MQGGRRSAQHIHALSALIRNIRMQARPRGQSCLVEAPGALTYRAKGGGQWELVGASSPALGSMFFFTPRLLPTHQVVAAHLPRVPEGQVSQMGLLDARKLLTTDVPSKPRWYHIKVCGDSGMSAHAIELRPTPDQAYVRSDTFA